MSNVDDFVAVKALQTTAIQQGAPPTFNAFKINQLWTSRTNGFQQTLLPDLATRGSSGTNG